MASCGPMSDSFLSLPISDARLLKRIESSAALPSWSGTMITYNQKQIRLNTKRASVETSEEFPWNVRGIIL